MCLALSVTEATRKARRAIDQKGGSDVDRRYVGDWLESYWRDISVRLVRKF
jgi:hypothetical protein